MPKKFRGENSKSVEARARKAAQKEAETERQQRQLEDEYWKEDDKNVLKKLHRKVRASVCALTALLTFSTFMQPSHCMLEVSSPLPRARLSNRFDNRLYRVYKHSTG